MKTIILLCLVLPYTMLAACHAVSVTGAGTKNGSNWSNAMDGNALLVNGTLTRGDTYYFAQGSYTPTGSTNFSQNASGALMITVKAATVTDQGQGCGLTAGWNDAMGVDGNTHQIVIPAAFIVSSDYWFFDGTNPASGSGIGCSALGSSLGCGFKVDNTCNDATCSQSKTLGFAGLNAASHVTFQYFEYAGASAGTVGLDIDQGETRNILGSPNGAACSSGIVTLTTDQLHRYVTGQYIATTSVSLAGFTNATYRITGVPTTTSLTVTAACTNAATGGSGSIAGSSGSNLPEEGPRFVNGSSDILLAHNYIHGVDGVPVTLDGASNVTVDHNWLYLTGGQNSAHSHQQGIQLSGGSVGSSHVTITNNAFQDMDGSMCVVGLDDGGASKTISSVIIAGNLCFLTSGNPNRRAGLSNGSFGCFNAISCDSWQVTNNTIAGFVAFWGPTSAGMADPITNSAIGVFSSAASNSWLTENNVFCGTANVAHATGAGITVDYNFYCGDVTGAAHPAETHGQDTLLTVGQTLVDYPGLNLKLVADTNAYNAAVSVSPDPTGFVRSSSRGAYQYGSTPTPGSQWSGSFTGTAK